MKDQNSALRLAREQEAIVRTLTTEVQRESRVGEETEGLRAQAVEESARLVSAMQDLSRARRVFSGAVRDRQPGAPSDEASRWLRILVVEDDDATRSAIARGLEPEYEVVTACNGVEGLKAASTLVFDAIVADIGMPEMDGLTMVHRIRQLPASARVPVVFLTAETAPERVAAGFSAGGTSYLVKPVDLALLELELRGALASPRE